MHILFIFSSIYLIIGRFRCNST